MYKKIIFFSLFSTLFLISCKTSSKGDSQKAKTNYDIIVYGGTSAGLTAAIQAKKMGKDVLVIEPSSRIGGLTAGGLGDTDTGNTESIGGIAREFYTKIGEKYGKDEPVWKFEPKIALEVFKEWLEALSIPVIYNERLDRKEGVKKTNNKITSIQMESGKIFYGKIFIDATYEGDLMATSGISYFIGRESNSKYNETLNGKRAENELPKGIDPYKIKGDSTSGLIARVHPNVGGDFGVGDTLVQAYCYRMCLTNNPENRIMIEKPEGYNEDDYEILFRAIEQGQTDRFFKFRLVSKDKTDSNNHSGVSTDYIGMNYNYPEADYVTREFIKIQHEIYQKGLVWTVQNHDRVPESSKAKYREWGLPKDEFIDNGHWTPQLYVRESRRMVSDYIITENVVLSKTDVQDAIGLGSYAMDSHHTQYYVNEKGYVSTEGGFYNIFNYPYRISYKSIIPKKEQCSNLFVPVCLSATHAAYGSARMEPVFMILGQSAAIAASLSIDNNKTIQDLNYNLLQPELIKYNQIISADNISENEKTIQNIDH